ncbi:MAG: hypothetical protein HPY50_03060 [Firmicutes bacterium]|nr:hypothetical protein [Bacillota bacterium]
MNDFDDIIRAKAVSEPIALPDGFEERNDLLISRLGAHSDYTKKHPKFPVFHFKLTAAAILIVLLLAGVCAAAYIFSGGDFFKQFYSDKAKNDTKNDYSYMNTEQLNNMASSTVGTVVNTDDLAVDVMGVIVSGNTAEIMLRVTAKQLDSVLYNTGIEPLENYRFHDASSWMSMPGSNGYMWSIGYLYSDKVKSLAPNQFEILYTMHGSEDFKKSQYTIKLTDFGYFDFSRADQFVPLYSGTWQFDVDFDPSSDTGKSVFVDKEITVGGYSFTVDRINITPLACTVCLSCNGDKKYLNEHSMEMFKVFSDGSKDCSLTLVNGTKLSSGQFEASSSGGVEGFTLILTFNGPISVDDVVSLSLFGTEYSLDK